MTFKVSNGLLNIWKLQTNVTLKHFKVRALAIQKKLFYFLQWKPFKNNEKHFLFHLKSSL